MINVDSKSSVPLYEQIIEQIKLHIMKGSLMSGNPIPSVRKMALELSITPGTVAKAYQELERQGIIETIRGKGTFIAETSAVRPDEARLSEIRAEIKSRLIELRVMGFDKKEISELIDDIYRGMSE